MLFPTWYDWEDWDQEDILKNVDNHQVSIPIGFVFLSIWSFLTGFSTDFWGGYITECDVQ